MKLPRDINGDELIRALRRMGYEANRQVGSHVILRSQEPRPHSVTVPFHRPIKVGTLAAILHAVAVERGLTTETVIRMMKL